MQSVPFCKIYRHIFLTRLFLYSDGLERIYNAKGNTYEAAVAMTGEMYSLLAVFMHYAEHEEKEKAIQLTYAEKAESYIETNYSYPITVEEIASYVGISRSHLFRSFRIINPFQSVTYLFCRNPPF